MKQPVWIDKRDVQALHEVLLSLHGGMAGVRDEGLLESALARVRQIFNYAAPDRIEMAAAYTVGIVRNHPFFDGNKRTGFVVGVLFLELNGYRFIASEENAANAVLSLAAGQMSEAEFASFLRSNVTKEKSKSSL